MMIISSAVLVFVSAIGVYATSTELPNTRPQNLSTNLSCTKEQTECLYGCCPYADGECCADGYECCKHGQACIPYLGICIGLKGERKKNLSLLSNRATPVEKLEAACPSGTTACGIEYCCPLPDAVCCSNPQYCCPHGYRCDATSQFCTQIPTMDSHDKYNVYSVVNLPTTTSMRSSGFMKTMRKYPYKSCPGGVRQCPSYMSCCLNNGGGWGCCPNPASPYYKKNFNDCCDTVFGYICCPDSAPDCTLLGCVKKVQQTEGMHAQETHFNSVITIEGKH